MYNQRDLLLVPIPFTDLSSQKIRPVIVVSNSQYNRQTNDLVVVGVTSNIKEEAYSTNLNNDEMEKGKLPLPSRIKCDKIYSIANKIVQRKYGKITQKKYDEIQSQIKKLIRD